jgi:glycolate oxidase
MIPLDELARLFPPTRLLHKPGELAPYESDALTAFRARPLAVVLPETHEEVVAAVRWCAKHQVPYVARGSGTSLSGGSLPIEGGLVIGLNRMNKLLRLEPQERIAVVQPGFINLQVSNPSRSRPLGGTWPLTRAGPTASSTA